MTYLPMKRDREEEIRQNLTSMANYLIHFSQGSYESFNSRRANAPGKFECRTCNRKFTSFQALGGHRASHKRPRVIGGDLTTHHSQLSPPKSKTHECSVCGLEFTLGQALGGHMRRHRATISENHLSPNLQQEQAPKKVNDKIPILGLDLNLTPLENDLEFGIQKIVPDLVDLYL